MKNSKIFQILSECMADEALSETKRYFNCIIFMVVGRPSLAELLKFMWGRDWRRKGKISRWFCLFISRRKENCFILWFLSQPLALGSPIDGIHPFCESIKSIKKFYEEQTQTRRSIGNGERLDPKQNQSGKGKGESKNSKSRHKRSLQTTLNGIYLTGFGHW